MAPSRYCLDDGLVDARRKDRLASERAAGVGELPAMAHLVQRDGAEGTADCSQCLLQPAWRRLGRAIQARLADLLEELEILGAQVAVGAQDLIERRIRGGVGLGFGPGPEE